jgi:hypothetical protein
MSRHDDVCDDDDDGPAEEDYGGDESSVELTVNFGRIRTIRVETRTERAAGRHVQLSTGPNTFDEIARSSTTITVENELNQDARRFRTVRLLK